MTLETVAPLGDAAGTRRGGDRVGLWIVPVGWSAESTRRKGRGYCCCQSSKRLDAQLQSRAGRASGRGSKIGRNKAGLFGGIRESGKLNEPGRVAFGLVAGCLAYMGVVKWRCGRG